MCIYNVKDKFSFFIIPDAFDYPNCLMAVPPYVVRVVQSQPNISKAFPVKSNIGGHNLLKTEIGIIFAPALVSILHLMSTKGPFLLPFVCSGTMYTPV